MAATLENIENGEARFSNGTVVVLPEDVAADPRPPTEFQPRGYYRLRLASDPDDDKRGVLVEVGKSTHVNLQDCLGCLRQIVVRRRKAAGVE